jgi:uncharacterized membrane protein YcaP (DUF421 family)
MFQKIALYISESFGFNFMTIPDTIMMIIRGIIIYFLGATLARFNKKLIGVRTPFNFLLFIILGSVFAQAIIDGSSFLPILGTILTLFTLNGLMTMLAYYLPSVESFVKGQPSILVKDGEIQWGKMKKYYITEQELLNELHRQLHTQNLNSVESAFLASDGTIIFIEKNT